MRSIRFRILFSLAWLLSPFAAARAATLTYDNTNHEASVDARVANPLNGYICDHQHVDLPAVIVTPSSDSAQASTGSCTGLYAVHSWLRIATLTSSGMSGSGSADAAYLGGGTGFTSDGNSTLGIGFGLDEPATLRVHLVWHKAVAGAGDIQRVLFSTVLCTGTCAGNLLSNVDTHPVDGDTTVDVSLTASPSYHIRVALEPVAETNPFDINQPALSDSGSFSVNLALVSTTGVEWAPNVARPQLGPAAPNPTRGGVDFALALPTAAAVRFDIVDIAGRRLARVSESRIEAGRESLHWNGLDSAGRPARPGLYFARVTIDGRTLAARSVLLIR